MGLMDKLMAAPPRGGAHKPEDSTHGGPASAAVGKQLAEDERAVTALDAQREAAAANANAQLAAEQEHPTPVTPPSQVPANFTAETYTLQPGEVVQISMRDLGRERMVVFNQSAAGGAKVALCATDRDARRGAGAGNFPPPRGIQVVPGGQVPRELKHTAPMFAVCDPGAAAAAVIDVYAERRASHRP